MLKFNRLIAGEQLDVTIESRKNIQMTGVEKKKSQDIKGDIRYDWTNETFITEGICGFQNNSLYCYMNSCLQCLLAIDNLRDYYA
jgi:ubiquitin C-terminal hydrolase